MEASPLASKFLRRFNPSPLGNFRKHLTLLPSEISEKSRDKKKIISAGFDPQFF
jgi:hypothetical protein